MRKNILGGINKNIVFRKPLGHMEKKLFLQPKRKEVLKYHFEGDSLFRTIIYFRSDVGCEHGMKTGGCVGCGHWRSGTAGKKLNISNMYIQQYFNAIRDGGINPIMCLYNEGSMLNPGEVPFDQLIFIVQHLANHGVKKLILECRPNHVKEDVLSPLKRAAKEMKVEIGMGLESSNDFVRNHLFLKSTTLQSYEKATSILHQYNFDSLAYVLIKPPFLNESQAINDAINTIEYAFEIGFDAVCLEPFSVAPHTVTEILYEHGSYKPPWLWSVIKVIKATFQKGQIRIGGFQFEPLPAILPENCTRCNDKVLLSFSEYNRTFDLTHLNSLNCDCYQDFSEEVNGLEKTIENEKLYEDILRFSERFHSLAKTWDDNTLQV
uniref:Elp3/MiaA/NifB-like radical SAM core domain-containing protein n=1 Tax=Candidatus Kentrum sp. MB TaxID=2138164 RepID=A0A451B9Q4_9GAMM|nr:MAG: hypothetical protein BECKMB1821I_GA0114274_101313 [Candidatus Kentron sp. MB]VFK75018.1 MAG: hypothetical protein BECKMB1821H_GA0114242_101414 [Candidatus Kentron sp. MB]